MKSTTRVELVEIHNLLLSLQRLSSTTPYDTYRWKRALYHALLMSGAPSYAEKEAIRKALGLP